MVPAQFVDADECALCQNPTYEHVGCSRAITRQLEWYFCDENLKKDTFMRGKLGSECHDWIDVDLIAGFPRIERLSMDRSKLIEMIKKCNTLELNDACTHLHRIN